MSNALLTRDDPHPTLKAAKVGNHLVLRGHYDKSQEVGMRYVTLEPEPGTKVKVDKHGKPIIASQLNSDNQEKQWSLRFSSHNGQHTPLTINVTDDVNPYVRTFQYTPFAHISMEFLEQSLAASAHAIQSGNVRNTPAIINAISSKHLSPEGREHAVKLLADANKHFQTLVRGYKQDPEAVSYGR